jgi:hypothetical protein
MIQVVEEAKRSILRWGTYSRNCLLEAPPASIHVVQRRRKVCRTLSNIPGVCCMMRQAARILAINSSCVSTGVSYTKDFMCPHRKKSRRVRSGDHGDQGMEPPLLSYATVLHVSRLVVTTSHSCYEYCIILYVL